MCRCLCAEWLLAAFDVKWPLNRLVPENRKEEVLYQFSPAFAWSSISRPCSFAKVSPMSSWCPTAALYEHGYQIGVFPPSVSEATVLCDASFMNRSREIFLLFDIRVVKLFSRRKGNFNSNRCIRRTPGEKTIVPQMLSHLCVKFASLNFFPEKWSNSNIIFKYLKIIEILQSLLREISSKFSPNHITQTIRDSLIKALICLAYRLKHYVSSLVGMH